MPVPRLFFILCICVPCLFVDDAVRSKAILRDDSLKVKELYCPVWDERNHGSTFSVIENSNHDDRYLLRSSFGLIDDSVLFDPFSQKPSESSDCHNRRFKLDSSYRKAKLLSG